MKMQLNGKYQFAYVQAEQQHRSIAYFASARSQEGHGNDVKYRSFIFRK